IAIPLVAPVAIPAMAIAALGIAEVGLDLAVGDNTSAAVGLLFLFPMGKGFKYVTEIGGDAIKGGSKAKNLYKLASKEWIESESIISIKALKHIFHGNTNWKGLPSGYHKASIMSKAKISNVSNPDKFGVYKATVEMKGKTKFSTFFPDSWSRVDVINSIKEAYRGIKLDKAGWYIGKTSSGMEIKMWLNDKGLVNTAFPIYSK
ncbi:EndoU domain-containing protein, partial [Clostridium sporogenes]